MEKCLEKMIDYLIKKNEGLEEVNEDLVTMYNEMAIIKNNLLEEKEVYRNLILRNSLTDDSGIIYVDGYDMKIEIKDSSNKYLIALKEEIENKGKK